MILLQTNVTAPGRDDEHIRLTGRVASSPNPPTSSVSPAAAVGSPKPSLAQPSRK
jgi:hypothetical protein